MPQFIYTMKGLGKIYPPDSVVFKDIWLSFLYGAKIGVIGSNGSGKSTLLKIMAGLDHDYQGEATLSAGYTVGYLAQEPTLDPTKTVLGNVEEGVAPVRALLTRFDEINAKFGEEMSPEEMEKTLEEQAKVQDAIEAAGAWDLDSKLGRAAAATAGCGCHETLRRRAPSCRPLPPLAAVAGHAAARRADQPPGCRVGGLARTFSARIRWHGRRHHARPLLSRQRCELDSGIGSGARISVGRELLRLA
jgi:energy-coupling factor transporter ATP-binding protein EcfA2